VRLVRARISRKASQCSPRLPVEITIDCTEVRDNADYQDAIVSEVNRADDTCRLLRRKWVMVSPLAGAIVSVVCDTLVCHVPVPKTEIWPI
jgi:hypothetical protein